MVWEPRSLGTSSSISRRRFIRTVGAVAATVALPAFAGSAQGPSAPGKAVAPARGQKGKEHGMLVVDAQIHIWTNGKPASRNHRQITDFTADDALKEMDEAGVDAAVIHPPSWDPNAKV